MAADHTCEVCLMSMHEHDEECERGCRHWPALCCPGCLCRSFEDAHEEPRDA